jgi:hypothetical protein
MDDHPQDLERYYKIILGTDFSVDDIRDLLPEIEHSGDEIGKLFIWKILDLRMFDVISEYASENPENYVMDTIRKMAISVLSVSYNDKSSTTETRYSTLKFIINLYRNFGEYDKYFSAEKIFVAMNNGINPQLFYDILHYLSESKMVPPKNILKYTIFKDMYNDIYSGETKSNGFHTLRDFVDGDNSDTDDENGSFNHSQLEEIRARKAPKHSTTYRRINILLNKVASNHRDNKEENGDGNEENGDGNEDDKNNDEDGDNGGKNNDEDDENGDDEDDENSDNIKL